MKRIIIVFFGLISITCLAQENLLILNNERPIGKNFRTNSEIKAKEFIFPERIDDSYLDTLTNYLTVQLRGTSKNGKWLNSNGNIVLYDLARKTLKWTKEINYQQGSLEQFDNVIIQTLRNKSYCLNPENGENIWEVKSNIYYVEPLRKVALGYKFKFANKYTNTLEGIDLNNGNSIWKREINREYSWNNIFHLNDSTVIVVAAGLHSINLKNGRGWDFDAITGDYDNSANIAANAAGVALGILTGTFILSSGNNLVRDIVSNVFVDSSNIYFASKENLVCLDYNGHIIWSSILPKNHTSKSTIFKKGNLIYIINKGYAFMGYRQIEYGTPFIASYNSKTGTQAFLRIIEMEKNPINDFNVKKDTLFLVFKDRVLKYSMNDGTGISVSLVDMKKYGELNFFIGKQVYIYTDSTYKSLTLSDSTKHFLFTKSRKILVANNKFEIVDELDFDKLFIHYVSMKDLKLIVRKNETTVIDNNGKKVAEIKASRKAILLDTKLYDMQERSFLEIEIKELSNN